MTSRIHFRTALTAGAYLCRNVCAHRFERLPPSPTVLHILNLPSMFSLAGLAALFETHASRASKKRVGFPYVAHSHSAWMEKEKCCCNSVCSRECFKPTFSCIACAPKFACKRGLKQGVERCISGLHCELDLGETQC